MQISEFPLTNDYNGVRAQVVPDADKPAMTCSTSIRNFWPRPFLNKKYDQSFYEWVKGNNSGSSHIITSYFKYLYADDIFVWISRKRIMEVDFEAVAKSFRSLVHNRRKTFHVTDVS